MNNIDQDLSPRELKILHYLLLFGVLFLFSKLTIDAIILGAAAIFFYQKWNEKND